MFVFVIYDTYVLIWSVKVWVVSKYAGQCYMYDVVIKPIGVCDILSVLKMWTNEHRCA